MKITHNSDYYQRMEQYSVRCPKYNKEATITVFYRSTKLCRTDIQLTPIVSGRKCSLWDENHPICPDCPHLK